MESHAEKNTLTKKEKVIVTLCYMFCAILILCIGYLIVTAFIEFPWEKNAQTISPEEFEAQFLNIANKIFLFAGITGGVFIVFNLMRFITKKFMKHMPQSENAVRKCKNGIIVGSIMLTASYLAYFLTNYEPGYSSGESDGSIATFLLLSIFVMNMFIWKKR